MENSKEIESVFAQIQFNQFPKIPSVYFDYDRPLWCFELFPFMNIYTNILNIVNFAKTKISHSNHNRKVAHYPGFMFDFNFGALKTK